MIVFTILVLIGLASLGWAASRLLAPHPYRALGLAALLLLAGWGLNLIPNPRPLVGEVLLKGFSVAVAAVGATLAMFTLVSIAIRCITGKQTGS
jgi:hypothetical protein